MKFLKKLLVITFLFASNTVFSQIHTEHYPLLSSFYSQGGDFEDKVHLYIVEFRHSSEVTASISYNKKTGDLILKFLDKSGSEHQEILKGLKPIYNTQTPSVITFSKDDDQDHSVSITEYNGGLSFIWNGEQYHMNS